MDSIDQAITNIVSEQALIMGPVAWEVASQVDGLEVMRGETQIHLSGESRMVIGDLVGKFESLFGRASVEVCRDAIRPVIAKIPRDKLPAILL